MTEKLPEEFSENLMVHLAPLAGRGRILREAKNPGEGDSPRVQLSPSPARVPLNASQPPGPAYLRVWRRTGSEEAALTESTRSHLGYNLVIAAIVIAALATGST